MTVMPASTIDGATESSSTADSPTVALLFANFGFYHLARFSALNAVCAVCAIEFAGNQKLYGWQTNRGAASVVTLHEGALEEMSAADMSRSLVVLWRKLQELRPLYLFIPGYSDPRCYVAALWALMHGARSILMYESTELDKPRTVFKELIKGVIIRFLFFAAFVGGKRSADYLQKLGFPLDKMRSKYDVVDNEFFGRGAELCRATSSRSKWNLPSNFFLFVGRLAPEKNGVGLLKAFREYRNFGGTWDLVLVGRGPVLDELLNLRDSLHLEETVHFAGFKNGEELFPYYAFAGCFVLPSTSEPWGLVVNEAMASGLPVLTSSGCGCAPDLVQEGVNGFTFPADRARELAELLIRISEMPSSSRQAMGLASRRIIAEYSPTDWAASAKQLVLGFGMGGGGTGQPEGGQSS